MVAPLKYLGQYLVCCLSNPTEALAKLKVCFSQRTIKVNRFGLTTPVPLVESSKKFNTEFIDLLTEPLNPGTSILMLYETEFPNSESSIIFLYLIPFRR